jgi:hypothetical protein
LQFKEDLSVLIPAAHLCLNLVSEPFVKQEMLRVGPIDALMKLVKRHMNPQLAVDGLHALVALCHVHSEDSGGLELMSLSPSQAAFVVHLLTPTYLDDIHTCNALMVDVGVLALDGFNAETLADAGACAMLIGYALKYAWDPVTSSRLYTALCAIIEATHSHHHPAVAAVLKCLNTPSATDAFQAMCQHVVDHRGHAAFQRAALTFINHILAGEGGSNERLTWLQGNGFIGHAVACLKLHADAPEVVAAALETLRHLMQDDTTRFTASSQGGALPVLAALRAHRGHADVVMPAVAILGGFCKPLKGWALLNKVASGVGYIVGTLRAHLLVCDVIQANPESPAALTSCVACLCVMCQHASGTPLADVLIQDNTVASILFAARHTPYAALAQIAALRCLQHLCGPQDNDYNLRVCTLADSGALQLIDTVWEQFGSNPAVVTACKDTLWKFATVVDDAARAYKRRVDTERREKLAKAAASGGAKPRK